MHSKHSVVSYLFIYLLTYLYIIPSMFQFLWPVPTIDFILHFPDGDCRNQKSENVSK